MDDIVIVGGGIIGTATAYFLSKEGRLIRRSLTTGYCEWTAFAKRQAIRMYFILFKISRLFSKINGRNP